MAFWRIYFYHVPPGRTVIASVTGDALRLSRWASYSLLLIVGGIICTAVGFGQIVEDPDPPIDWALVVIIFGGPMLVLIGRTYLEQRAESGPRCRVLLYGVLALAVAAPPMLLLPPVASAVGAAVILAVIAVYDGLTHRRGPDTNPEL